jgi:hypothetical protein
MNWMDRHLERLFRAAALAPQRPAGELSFAAEARVLSQWRAAPGQAWGPSLLPLFRTGLAFACALLLATVALSLRQMKQTTTDEWSLPNAVVNLALTR